MNEALDRYIDVHEWQVRHIQEGVDAAEREEFATEREVEEFFKQLTTLNEEDVNSLD